MTNKILVTFFTSFFLIISNTANSNEIYCLDKEGLILPVFDKTDCNNSTDIQIDQDEFRFIIQHDASQRLIKLEDFRKNKKEESSKIASDSSNNSTITYALQFANSVISNYQTKFISCIKIIPIICCI